MITTKLRAEWRAQLLTRGTWAPDHPRHFQGDAERVHHDVLTAWRRPARSPDRTAAAVEKLCSDLAHDAGLPSAPVLLLQAPWWGGDVPQAVSLQCHRHHRHVEWDAVPRALHGFWALINGYPHGAWTEGWDERGGPRELVIYHFGDTALRRLDGPLRRLTAEELEPVRRLTDDAIRDVVERIPRTFMSDPPEVARQLCRRRRRLLEGETRPERHDWMRPPRRGR